MRDEPAAGKRSARRSVEKGAQRAKANEHSTKTSLEKRLEKIKRKLQPLILSVDHSVQHHCAVNLLDACEQNFAAIEQLTKLKLILISMISFIEARVPTLLRGYVTMEDADGAQKLLNDFVLTKSTADCFVLMAETITAMSESVLQAVDQEPISDILLTAAAVSHSNALIVDHLNTQLNKLDDKLSDLFGSLWTSVLITWCTDEYGSLLDLMECADDSDPLEFE